MTAYPHQTELALKIAAHLRLHGLCYVAAEERVGKTLSALLAAKDIGAERLLIVTKKKALGGWEETLNQCGLQFEAVELVNYESIHKLSRSVKRDLVILDESHHALGAYPKSSLTARRLQPLTYDLKTIFLSATPSAQTYAQLFHQLNMTKYSPWDGYANFYKWHLDYGIPKSQYISGRIIKKYDDVKEEKIKPILDTYFLSLSRKEVGFKYEPEDVIHYVTLSEKTKGYYKEIEKTWALKDWGLAVESASKELWALHQIEGATLKLQNGEAIFTGTNEKINYILQHFGDREDIVIFYHYIAEGELLRTHFKNVKILQGDAFAEGVDLSSYAHCIVYSMSFSAAKYTQRRARQCSVNRNGDIKVHYLLVSSGISEQAYKSVALKRKNFVMSYYKKALF